MGDRFAVGAGPMAEAGGRGMACVVGREGVGEAVVVVAEGEVWEGGVRMVVVWCGWSTTWDRCVCLLLFFVF